MNPPSHRAVFKQKKTHPSNIIVPENTLRRRRRRRRRPLTEIEETTTVMITTVISSSGCGWLIKSVLVGSDDPNRRPMGRGGRVVFDLYFHAPQPLPVAPLQDKICRRRLPRVNL